jgi:hypothetical protein
MYSEATVLAWPMHFSSASDKDPKPSSLSLNVVVSVMTKNDVEIKL